MKHKPKIIYLTALVLIATLDPKDPRLYIWFGTATTTTTKTTTNTTTTTTAVPTPSSQCI